MRGINEADDGGSPHDRNAFDAAHHSRHINAKLCHQRGHAVCTRRRIGEELRSRAAGLQPLEPVGETRRVEYILQSFASEIVKK